MIKKVVINRFEGKRAVLLVEKKPMIVLWSALPKEVKGGDWLEAEFVGECMVRAKVDVEEKERMRKRIEEKLVGLRGGKG
jgi:hypothetical protein